MGKAAKDEELTRPEPRNNGLRAFEMGQSGGALPGAFSMTRLKTAERLRSF
jgi:hypothetical protein